MIQIFKTLIFIKPWYFDNIWLSLNFRQLKEMIDLNLQILHNYLSLKECGNQNFIGFISFLSYN